MNLLTRIILAAGGLILIGIERHDHPELSTWINLAFGAYLIYLSGYKAG